MHRYIQRSMILGVVSAGALSSVALAGAASLARPAARSDHFVSRCTGKLSGETTAVGSCHSNLGSYTYVVSLHTPKYTEIDHYKNGTIHISGVDKIQNGGLYGTWKITGGTGAFKHASGSGSGLSKLANGRSSVTYRGTVRP
jgi:hypothetical protein